MKNKLKYVIITLIISFILIPHSYTVNAKTISKGECVMEVESERILYSHNQDLKLPMASTTKILTAITVIDNFDINKKVTISKECVGIEGSSIYLREGEILTVKELLYGLMLRSGNDCAESLARLLIKRSDFISLMNKTAKKIGANSSNFINPHGLHDENHYTTAYDLCKITCYAMKNQTFRDIVSTKRINISNDGYDYDRVLINKNKMLFNYEGSTGVKTGYTKKAGRCLVSSAKRKGLEVISVVINSPDMWGRTEELLDNSFNNYKMVEIINQTEFNEKVYFNKNNKPFMLNVDCSFSYPLCDSEIEAINYKFNGKTFDEFIKNPDKNAIFEIFIENKLIFSQNIFTILSK